MKINNTENNRILSDFKTILNNKTDVSKDEAWFQEMRAIINHSLPSISTVLPLTSASSLMKTLKDTTPVDPYGPGAVVPYCPRTVAKQ